MGSEMERIDDLQYKGFKLIQDTDLFCFGTDAVLLAHFAKVQKNARVVDLGTGTGIITVLMYSRQQNAKYTMVEIQKPLFEIAKRNIELNNMENNVNIIHGDIKEVYEVLGGGFDVVVTNPPYEKALEGEARSGESHLIARKEVCVDFNEICVCAKRLLKSKGKFYFIHKANRLAELFYTLKCNNLEPKMLRMVQAKDGAPPKYVLVCAQKDAKEGIVILPSLTMFDADGNETQAVRDIYCRGEA